MIAMKNVYSKMRKHYTRIVSVILCLTFILSYVNINVFSADDERSNRLNEWVVEVTWDNSDTTNYSITSSEDETLRPKMVLKYYATQADRDYLPGEVRFTIGGIDDIERERTISATTTMEKSDSKWEMLETGAFNEYTFTNRVEIKRGDSLSGGFEIMWEFESRDSYNNYTKTIAPVFSAKNDQGLFDSITLPDLNFSYRSERDFYYLNIESKNITSDEYEDVMAIGSDGSASPYERYTWHNETVKFNPQIKARGANLSDFFVCLKITDTDDPDTGNEIPAESYKDVQVLRNDGTRTTLKAYNLYDITHQESDRNKTVYGFYEFTDKAGDISNDDYIFYLGYPYEDESGQYIPTFDNHYIHVKCYLNILYKDDTEYVTLNNDTVENEKIVADAVKRNEYYGFAYRGGTYSHYQYNNRYEIVDMENKGGDHRPPAQFDKLVSAELYKNKIVNFDLEMNAKRLYSNSGAKANNSKSAKNDDAVPPVDRDEGVYLLQGIDRLAVELEDGTLSRLSKDEYDISIITVPKDKYNRNYKIYVTETPDVPYENYVYFGEGVTSADKTFSLPRDKYCGFYVKMEDVNGTYQQITTAGVRFHLNSRRSPKINPNGKVISFSFFRVHYIDKTDGSEKLYFQVLKDDYKGEYTQTIAADDLRTQGEYVYRRYSNVYLREPIVHLSSFTYTTDIEREEGEEYVKAIDDVYGGGYAFLVSTDGQVLADTNGDLRKFSIHTLLPEELKPNEDLSEIQYNSSGILERIRVDGEVIDLNGTQIKGQELENYVRYTLKKRDDGKTVVSAFFDFTESPLRIRTISEVKITFPVRVSRMDYKSGTKDFIVTSYTSIQDEITNQIKGTYIQNDIDDIDDNPNTLYVAKSESVIEGSEMVEHWENKIYKSVKTYFSNGFTSAQIDNALGIDNRVFTFGREAQNDQPEEKTSYTYRLEMKIEEPLSNIVMYDNIEPQNNTYVDEVNDNINVSSRWHGDLINVNTSKIQSLNNVDCTVYYSTNEKEAYSGVTGSGVVSGGWRPMSPNSDRTVWTVPASENGKARSIAVFIDTKGEAVSKNIMYAEINMHAPTYPDQTPAGDYLAQNAYKLVYETDSEVIPEYMFSSVTNVELYKKLPIVSFSKVDSENRRPLKGAKFELYLDKNNNGTGEENELTDSGTTNNLGKWTTYKMEYGNKYLLYEVETPPGYEAIENPKTIVLNAADNKEEYTFEIENKRVKGTVHITKKDYDGFIQGNLKGAGFEMYKSNGEQVFFVDNGDNTYTYDENAVNVKGVLYTGENGLTANQLPWGNYYIVEVVAPQGFEINGASKKFSIMSSSTTVEIEKTDVEKTASLRLKKFSETGEALPNAWYQLEKWDKDQKAWVVQADYLSTNESGITEVKDLKFGYYRFVEVNAPVGYELNADPIAKSPLADEIKVFGLESGREFNVLNYVDRSTGIIALNRNTADLTIQVNDINYRQRGEATLKKTGSDGTPLKGAKFDLYMVVEGSDTGKLIKSGLVTDSEGRISQQSGVLLSNGLYGVNNLDWGRYYFKETYAPTGYMISDEPFYFDIDSNNLEIDITIQNNRKPGSIRLTKYAAEDTTVGGTVIRANSVLAGAKFSLYEKGGALIKVKKLSVGNYTVSSVSGENTETLVETNASGQFYIDNLQWGSYYLEEKQAPNGFKIADKVRFVVNSHTCSATQELECFDEAIQCEIIINKEVDDIVDSFGTPVFFFKVTDANNPSNSFIKSITVDKLTRKGSVSFSVPIGVYNVEEIRVARYTLESAGKTVNGKTVNAVVTTNSKNVVQCVFSSSTSGAVADLTFINKLTNYDYVGHNAIATNIIPKNREITGISLEYPNVVPAEKNSSGYTIQARDLIGHFIYDDGEQSENPLTVQELESLSFPDGLTVQNDAANANTVQVLRANYTLSNGRRLSTTFDVTVAPLETKPVQKVTFYVDGNNSCYFLKNGKRTFSNVVYYSDGEIISGEYIIPTVINEDEEEQIRWSDKALYGTALAESDEASVLEYLAAHPGQTEIELYAKLGKLIVEFGNPSGDPAPDDPGSYEIDDDPNNPDNPDNPEYSDDPASSDKNVETFIVPADGYYYLETWGASGGDLLEGADYANRQLDKHAGHGGYSYSVAYLTKGTKLYIHLGGKGMNYSESKAKLPDNESQFGGAVGAANGGGNAGNDMTGSGGGMTHISLVYNPASNSEQWSSAGTLIAAGGGGGAGSTASGSDAVSYENADTANAHGSGGNSSAATSGGGGGGWYGGSGGNGGAGYIADGTVNANNQTAVIVAGETKGGNEIVPQYDNAILDQSTGQMIGNIGSGFARITYLENEAPLTYTGKVERFIAPETGYYKLEAWGASGGDAIKPDMDNLYNIDISTWETIEGGRGGYSAGTIHLNKGDIIYYAVGGKGESFIDNDVTTLGSYGGMIDGGFNGGGAAAGREYHNQTKVVYYSGAGGGATHFALALPSDSSKTGVLADYINQKSDVLLVAGGGGGSGTSHNITSRTNTTYGAGGAGGGTEGQGNHDYYSNVGRKTIAYGGTQTEGGTFARLTPTDNPLGSKGYFGQGGYATNYNADLDGGGGGWYGGAAVGRMGAAGGSGYVNTGRLSDGQNITGNTANFTTKGGNLVTPTPIPAFEGAVGIEKGAKTMIGNRGNGHARITFIGKNN